MGRRKSESEEIEVFLENIKVDPVTGCYEWMGGKASNGRGIYTSGGRSVLAYRYAWTMIIGDIPDGMCVCHRCDNPSCVNVIEHCFLGTKKSNSEDAVKKDRYCRNPRPSRPVSRAELTKMVKMHIAGVSFYKIAKVLGRSSQQLVKSKIEKYLGIGSAAA
jgi:hypothetical protein